MKKIIILIPVFNDWESLKKLLIEINENILNIKEIIFDCLVINDASTIDQSILEKPKKIRSLKILNMKENRGHARCNAFGIRYVNIKEEFDYLILMDGDGEDRPVEIKSLINQAIKNSKNSVVAKRIKRSEGPFFKFLYFMHKIITLVFTGKKINFGNYSCLTRKDVEKIASVASLWSSYSGTIKKNLKNLSEIDSIRGTRYFGPSKMSLFKLLIHSLSIIAVFKYLVLLRSTIIILILGIIGQFTEHSLIFFQTLILIFNIVIFLISRREKQEDLNNSQENLKNIKIINN